MINQLPLERFREILGYNPYHFWGQANSVIPITSNCNTAVKQYQWQNADAAGRQEIREAIATAEARLFEYLGYRVGPRWVTKELQYPWPYDAGLEYAYSQDIKGRWLSMFVGEGYIQEVGIEAYTLIGDGANVTFTDQYGDGINDTATLTVDLTGLDPQPTADEIAVFFTPSDMLDGDDESDRANYEIRPIHVDITGTTLTIKIRSWLLVIPIKYQGYNKAAVDPSDTANSYALKLDVYRRYNDPTGTLTTNSQAVLIWESDPPAWATCSTSDLSYSGNRYDPYSTATAAARVNIRDRKLGYLGPVWSSYSATNDEWTAVTWDCKQPDRVRIRYKAGAIRNEINAQLPGGQWDQIVARLAMAELSRPICACRKANVELDRWQYDLSQTSGNNEISFQAIAPEQLNNPFGTRRGAVYAWQQVRNLKTYKAVIV